MTNDRKQNDDNNKEDINEYYFKVWKSYEDVAMHFNDLIIRLRIQSIGGIAALATILGIVLKSSYDKAETFNYGLALLAMICLILFWIAIWILDLRYYNRLLEGAVNAILELEKNKQGFLKRKEITLSTNIERAFHKRFGHERKGLIKRTFTSRNAFYLFVLFALVIVVVSTSCMCYRNYKQKEITSGISEKGQNLHKDSHS